MFIVLFIEGGVLQDYQTVETEEEAELLRQDFEYPRGSAGPRDDDCDAHILETSAPVEVVWH